MGNKNSNNLDSPNNGGNQASSRSLSIGIIGAGGAGLACASFLKSKGFQVEIFEALNRTGGRIHEVKDFCDGLIEVGGELIHGSKSVLYDLAKKVGAELIPIKAESTIYCLYEGRFEEVDELWDTVKDQSFQAFWNLYEDLTENCKGKYPDTSIKEFMQSRNFSKESYYLAEGLLGGEYSSDIDRISIKGVFKANDEWDAGSTDHYIKNMSMNDVLRKAFSNVLENINYNKKIVKIDYQKDKITIFDQNDSPYTFDKCVLAVPLPQLSKIDFSPKLSPKKSSCLSLIEIDPGAKVFLKFSQPVWPKKMSFLIIPGRINLFWSTKRGKDFILVGLVGGRKCNELTKIYRESKEKFKEIIGKDLEFGLKKDVMKFLLDVLWVDWGDIEIFGGGYAHPIVGEGNARDILKEPINKKIYFAGDTFSLKHSSTLHGAIETGFEVGNQILRENK